MKTLKITFCLLLITFMLSAKLFAQDNTKLDIDKLSIGLNFGSLLTYGDVKQYDFWPTPDERKWGYGAVINYQISPIFSVQAQGLMGNLAGIKRTFLSGKPANLKFDAQIYEGSFNATVSLNRWWAPHLKCNDWLNVYGIAGIGLINFRTQLRGLKDDKFIKSYGWSAKGTVKEKMTTETVVPVGLGVKIKVHEKIDINLESTIRNINTDKLDAYVRANNSQDKYGYTFLGITYRIGKKDKHMEWMQPRDLEKAAETSQYDKLAQQMEELNKKVTDLEAKMNEKPEVADMDLDKLAELNKKLSDLDARNKDLNSKISNIQIPTATGTAKSALTPVFFDVNKSEFDRNNADRVLAAATFLMANPNAKIELVGHADKTGGQKFNEMLSERRAKAVYEALVKTYGIDASRLSISYKGANEPLSQTNLDINRRVDFIIK